MEKIEWLVKQEEILKKTKFKDLEEWDSMTALTLIAMFDEQYDVKINGDDIKNATTLADLFAKTQK